MGRSGREIGRDKMDAVELISRETLIAASFSPDAMNNITYNGYTARAEFDERDNVFVGRLLGIQDIVSFHGDNVSDLRTAFEEAVEDYLEACAKLSKPANAADSGNRRGDPA